MNFSFQWRRAPLASTRGAHKTPSPLPQAAIVLAAAFLASAAQAQTPQAQTPQAQPHVAQPKTGAASTHAAASTNAAASTRELTSAKSAPASQLLNLNSQHAFRAAKFLPLSSVSQRTLSNGVRGIVQETHGGGVVAIQVWVRAGSRYESNAEAGASHLIETVALRSSRAFPESADGPRGALEALGASVASQTTRDAVSYSVSVAPRFASAALRILSDAVLHPRLAETEVETTKAEIGGDISRRPFSGLDAASIDLRNAEDIAYNAAFARHPYRRPTSGTLQSVLSLNAARARIFHARRYVGKNISVVVSGEIGDATAHSLIAKNFAAAKIAAAPDAKVPVETKAPAARLITRRGYSPRPTTVLAYRSPSIAQPDDVVAMDVLLAYLGEGREASLRRLLMGEPTEESAAASAPASTRGTMPDAPELQAMPDTMLEDRSPATADETPRAAEVAPQENAAENAASSAAAAQNAASTRGRAAPQNSADAANSSAATPSDEEATASAPHIPPPPAVFLPQIGITSREVAPRARTLQSAFSRDITASRVLARRAQTLQSVAFDAVAKREASAQNAGKVSIAARSFANAVAGAKRQSAAARVLASYIQSATLFALPRLWRIQDSAPPTSPPNAPQATPPTASIPAALAFDTAFLTQRDNGIVAFSLVTENENRARAVNLVQDELRRVRTNGLAEDGLARAKTELMLQYLRQGETPTGRAGAFGFYDMISTYSFATTYIERIRRITSADIKRVAARYFTAKPLVTVQIESPPQPDAQPDAPRDGGIVA